MSESGKGIKSKADKRYVTTPTCSSNQYVHQLTQESEVRPRGAHNIPRSGPVIFVGAPHNNQFLDPLLLMSEVWRETKRPVSFLVAEKSMRRPEIGNFCRFQVSVKRSIDDAKKGTGLLTLSKGDPLIVIGRNTKFTKELKPMMSLQIRVPEMSEPPSAEVVQIVSDTEVRIKRPWVPAAEKLFATTDTKGIEFKILPHVDQAQMYGQVHSKLSSGGCIGIFPEGGSHDRTDLLPLKIGVTIMALGAMAADPELKVKIVPVGMSYFHAHKFRSRAVVEYGTPLDVPFELVSLFALGGEGKRKACSDMLDIIYDGLKIVTLRSPDYETLMVIQAGRRLYRAPGQHLSLGHVVELNKRLIAGYLKFKDEPSVQELRKKILKYNRLLQTMGLKDHQVELVSHVGLKSLGLLLYRCTLLVVWSTLSLPGVILNSPIFLTAKFISRRKAKEALAASSVKIKARDVVATWKILVSMLLTPLLYICYALLTVFITHKRACSTSQQLLIAALTLLAMPFMSLSALRFGEVGMDVYKSLPPLILSLLPGNHKVVNDLKQMRNELSEELSNVIDTFGPEMYGDEFARIRLMTPGKVRAEEKTDHSDIGMLTSSMSWLDETLFGWSRDKQGENVRLSDQDSSEANADAKQDFDTVVSYLSESSSLKPQLRKRK